VNLVNWWGSLKTKFVFSDLSFTHNVAARWQDLMSRWQKSWIFLISHIDILFIFGQRGDNSVGCLCQTTIRFRRGFFFIVDAKRQIWLTSDYDFIFRKFCLCRHCSARSSVYVFKKLTELRWDILESVSTLYIELNSKNCKELADHPFRVTYRTNEFTVNSANVPNKTRSSATEPACSSDRTTSLKGLVKTSNTLTHDIHAIFILYSQDIHWISVFKYQGLHHGKHRHQPFRKFAQIFVGLQLKIFKPQEFYPIETFWRQAYPFTRTHTDVNSHVCEGLFRSMFISFSVFLC